MKLDKRLIDMIIQEIFFWQAARQAVAWNHANSEESLRYRGINHRTNWGLNGDSERISRTLLLGAI